MRGRNGWSLSGKQVLTVLAGTGLSLSVLGWAFYQVNLESAASTLRRFGFWWTAPMLLCYLSSFFIRGIRWRLLLRPVATVSWCTSTGVVFTGYMANNLLPLRLGEIVRALVLGRLTSARVEGTLSTIVLERVLDGLVLVGMISLVLVGSEVGQKTGGVVAFTGATSALVFLGALLFVVAARLSPRFILGVVRRTLGICLANQLVRS